jgi:hypothetical protein
VIFSDSGLSTAIKLSIASVLATDSSYITINSLTATSRRRALLTTGAEVVYTISVPNMSASSLSATLSTSIALGSFTTALRNNGETSATASAAPTIATLSSGSDPSPAGPSSSPVEASFYSSKQDLTKIGIYVGIAIGLLVIILIVVLALRYTVCKGNRRGQDREYLVHEDRNVMNNLTIDLDGHSQSGLDLSEVHMSSFGERSPVATGTLLPPRARTSTLSGRQSKDNQMSTFN